MIAQTISSLTTPRMQTMFQAKAITALPFEQRCLHGFRPQLPKQIRPIPLKISWNWSRMLLNGDHVVKKKCSASSYAEAPLVFEMATPVWSPLYSAIFESIFFLLSAFVTVKILQYVTKKVNEESWSTELAPDSRVKRNKTVMGTILRSISSPMSLLLPTAAVLHSIRVLTCRMEQSLQLCATCSKNTFERNAEVVLDVLLRILSPLDDVVGFVLKQGFLLAGIWFFVTFKNQFVSWVLEQKARRDPALLQDIRRIIIPINTLTTWVIVAVGIMSAAALAGVDVRPVVTFGGVSGIVIGLASQSVLANMIAGINLFLSRPFVAGDRVQVFSNNGSLIYNGLVERVNPLRTIIRTDKNYPLTVPNKLLADMVIGNESRFPTKATTAFESGRRVGITLSFGLEHFDKLDEASHNIQALLESFPGLNHGMPFGVSVGTLTDANLTLEIYATALKRESTKFGELRVRLMRALRDTLSEAGIDGYKLSF